MRILAIETSLTGGSVAVLENDQLQREAALDPGLRTTRSLSPTMQQILRDVGWQPNDVAGVGVAIGPGSFTGLRIGVTAAKAFAYATGASLVGVSTLQVLAAQVPPTEAPLWAVLNAERAQLFASQYRSQDGQWVEVSPPRIMDLAAWSELLSEGTLVTGPALIDLQQTLPPHVAVVDRELWTPRAATVGRLAFHQFQAGRRDDVWALTPFYLRESAAVEKAAGK